MNPTAAGSLSSLATPVRKPLVRPHFRRCSGDRERRRSCGWWRGGFCRRRRERRTSSWTRGAGDHRTSCAVARHVPPRPLLGVQLGRVRRQVEPPQRAGCLGHKVLDGLGRVRGAVVDDQECGTVLVVDEPAQELHVHRGGRALRGHHESPLPLGGDRGDHIRREAAPGCPHHRGPAWAAQVAPRRWPVRIPASSPKQITASSRWASLWMAGQSSSRHRCTATESCRSVRSRARWGARPQTLQQPAHHGLAEADSELRPDQLLDHRAPPGRKREAPVHRVLAGGEADQPPHLLGPQPLVDDRAMETQRLDHDLRTLAIPHDWSDCPPACLRQRRVGRGRVHPGSGSHPGPPEVAVPQTAGAQRVAYRPRRALPPTPRAASASTTWPGSATGAGRSSTAIRPDASGTRALTPPAGGLRSPAAPR